MFGFFFSIFALHHWLYRFWATQSGNRVWACAQSTAGHPDGFRFVSLPSVLSISRHPTATTGSSTWTTLKSNFWRKRGRAVQLHLVHSPTDHFTYQRQVNPFIVMKWGSVMYSGCERLNPALSFLWGRQIHADLRTVQRPRVAQELSIKYWCCDRRART